MSTTLAPYVVEYLPTKTQDRTKWIEVMLFREDPTKIVGKHVREQFCSANPQSKLLSFTRLDQTARQLAELLTTGTKLRATLRATFGQDRIVYLIEGLDPETGDWISEDVLVSGLAVYRNGGRPAAAGLCSAILAAVKTAEVF